MPALFKGSRIWNTILTGCKNLKSLVELKQQIKMSNKLKCGNLLPVSPNYVKHIRCLF